MARVTVSKLSQCPPCRVTEIRKHQSPEPFPSDFNMRMTGLGAGTVSLEQHGGSARFRLSPIAALVKWGQQFSLNIFPGAPIVYKAFITHRILVTGVSTATMELDMIAISTLHNEVKALLGLPLHNPCKQDEIRIFIQRLSTSVRIKSKCTVPFAFAQFVTLIKSLDVNDPKQLHARACLQVVGLAGLRRGAAQKLYIKRNHGKVYSLDFAVNSDVKIYPHPKYRWVMSLRKDLDKCMAPGREQFSFIPDIMKCGLNPVSDVIRLITKYPLHDGPFLASFTGSRGTGFNAGELTALDAILRRSYFDLFPERAGEKVAPHSLRKMIIQALYDWLKMGGTYSEADIGEFIGWWSTKNATRPHYAGLGEEEVLAILASIDMHLLPSSISTVYIGHHL